MYVLSTLKSTVDADQVPALDYQPHVEETSQTLSMAKIMLEEEEEEEEKHYSSP